MRTKVPWLLASLLVAAALVLLSCGPKAAPTPTPTPTPAPTPGAPAPTPTAPATPVPTPAVPTLEEKPKYGGTINIILNADVTNWDNNAAPVVVPGVVQTLYNQLLEPDWAKGPAGSRIVDLPAHVERWEGYSPGLSESFKIPELGTWVFQIRKGVRYGLNPKFEASKLVNGREMTTDDIVWNVNRQLISPLSALNRSTYVGIRSSLVGGKPATVEKTGPWEVTIKTPTDPWAAFFWVTFGSSGQMFTAPEVDAKYGNHAEWQNLVGMGPYMIDDYVSGSQVTLIKNPNYWGKNLVGSGKGDQTPYIDTAKFFVIPDISTRMATMRTNRADLLLDVPLEDFESLINTTPHLKYNATLPTALGISLKIEDEKLPFKDVKVRQALMYATDFEAMKKDLFKGKAEVGGFPTSPKYDWLYIPMEKRPAAVQDLYKYNPEKAKQLLTEAGYPKGFKTRMIVQNISSSTDMAAVVKAMWSKVGVDVEIQPRETAVYTSISNARSWEEMLMGTSGMQTRLMSMLSMSWVRGASIPWQDKQIEAANTKIQNNVIVNMAVAEEEYRRISLYSMEQAFTIPFPAPHSTTVWQPWIKNYRGELPQMSWRMPLSHMWIDRDLKEKVTGRR